MLQVGRWLVCASKYRLCHLFSVQLLNPLKPLSAGGCIEGPSASMHEAPEESFSWPCNFDQEDCRGCLGAGEFFLAVRTPPPPPPHAAHAHSMTFKTSIPSPYEFMGLGTV